jgi:penicillin-binding protein 2
MRKWMLGLGILSFLWTACGTSTPAPPTATLTPAASLTAAPTDTPVPTPTPLPSASAVVQGYFDAWQAGDYAAMYAALTPASQTALPAPDFQQQYRTNLDIMTANTLTGTVASVNETGDTAQAQVQLTYATRFVGVLNTTVSVDLVRSNGLWAITYAPAMIWPELINGQQLYMVPFPADRGTLYDRNAVPMVTQADAVAVGVVPGEITPDDDALASGLGRLFERSAASIAALWEFAPPDQYLPIGTTSAAELAKLSWLENISGIRVTPYSGRYYYGSGAAAHVTGYTRYLHDDELADYLARGYSADQRIGETGLEAWGEALLSGRNGGQLTLLDSAGQPLRAIAFGENSPAQDIYTTLDFDLQQAAEFALGAYTGAVVAIRLDTGEVMAMASSPTFDPNLFDPANLNTQFFNGSNLSAGLINHAAQDAYPAGSVFKLVTFSAALTSGLFTPESLYTCTGTWEELGPSLVLHDWKEDGHGELTLSQGLSASCNPWFYHVGKALYDWNANWLPETARAFGLGQPTGLAQISEIGGLIPSPDWKLQNKGQAWEVVDSLNLAIGQGDVLVSPLQMARLVAAIGNNGTLYQPQLVLKIQPAEGAPTFEMQPVAVGTLPITPEQLLALQTAMHNVTQEPVGTARNRFRNFRIPIYGKTGTAETAQADPHAWFVGYTFAQRADQPDIAIAVWVQNIGQGSDIAAPIFRRVVEAYFDLPYTRYPWEESVGVVKTPEPTPTEGLPAETETPAP